MLWCSARPGARPGRRRRRCQWAAGARAQAARRGAAPCSATTPGQGRARPANGTGTTGYNNIPMSYLQHFLGYQTTTDYIIKNSLDYNAFSGTNYVLLRLNLGASGQICLVHYNKKKNN